MREELKKLVGRRWRIAVVLTAVMVATYFGFILLVAFDKEAAGTLVADGRVSVGILLGAALIVLAPLLIAIYVRWANRALRPGLRSSAASARGERRMPRKRRRSASRTPSRSSLLRLRPITLGITYWAARDEDDGEFFAAGGTVSAAQNGFALAGDYMSAASFLGIAGLVSLSGFDGLIYSIGFLVGWPVITFLIAEPLRNLGKYTFADVVAYRLQQRPVRIAAAIATLAVVIVLSDRADGRRRQPRPPDVRPAVQGARRASSAS